MVKNNLKKKFRNPPKRKTKDVAKASKLVSNESQSTESENVGSNGGDEKNRTPKDQVQKPKFTYSRRKKRDQQNSTDATKENSSEQAAKKDKQKKKTGKKGKDKFKKPPKKKSQKRKSERKSNDVLEPKTFQGRSKLEEKSNFKEVNQMRKDELLQKEEIANDDSDQVKGQISEHDYSCEDIDKLLEELEKSADSDDQSNVLESSDENKEKIPDPVETISKRDVEIQDDVLKYLAEDEFVDEPSVEIASKEESEQTELGKQLHELKSKNKSKEQITDQVEEKDPVEISSEQEDENQDDVLKYLADDLFSDESSAETVSQELSKRPREKQLKLKSSDENEAEIVEHVEEKGPVETMSEQEGENQDDVLKYLAGDMFSDESSAENAPQEGYKQSERKKKLHKLKSSEDEEETTMDVEEDPVEVISEQEGENQDEVLKYLADDKFFEESSEDNASQEKHEQPKRKTKSRVLKSSGDKKEEIVDEVEDDSVEIIGEQLVENQDDVLNYLADGIFSDESSAEDISQGGKHRSSDENKQKTVDEVEEDDDSVEIISVEKKEKFVVEIEDDDSVEIISEQETKIQKATEEVIVIEERSKPSQPKKRRKSREKGMKEQELSKARMKKNASSKETSKEKEVHKDIADETSNESELKNMSKAKKMKGKKSSAEIKKGTEKLKKKGKAQNKRSKKKGRGSDSGKEMTVEKKMQKNGGDETSRKSSKPNKKKKGDENLERERSMQKRKKKNSTKSSTDSNKEGTLVFKKSKGRNVTGKSNKNMQAKMKARRKGTVKRRKGLKRKRSDYYIVLPEKERATKEEVIQKRRKLMKKKKVEKKKISEKMKKIVPEKSRMKKKSKSKPKERRVRFAPDVRKSKKTPKEQRWRRKRAKKRRKQKRRELKTREGKRKWHHIYKLRQYNNKHYKRGMTAYVARVGKFPGVRIKVLGRSKSRAHWMVWLDLPKKKKPPAPMWIKTHLISLEEWPLQGPTFLRRRKLSQAEVERKEDIEWFTELLDQFDEIYAREGRPKLKRLPIFETKKPTPAKRPRIIKQIEEEDEEDNYQRLLHRIPTLGYKEDPRQVLIHFEHKVVTWANPELRDMPHLELDWDFFSPWKPTPQKEKKEEKKVKKKRKRKKSPYHIVLPTEDREPVKTVRVAKPRWSCETVEELIAMELLLPGGGMRPEKQMKEEQKGKKSGKKKPSEKNEQKEKSQSKKQLPAKSKQKEKNASKQEVPAKIKQKEKSQDKEESVAKSKRKENKQDEKELSEKNKQKENNLGKKAKSKRKEKDQSEEKPSRKKENNKVKESSSESSKQKRKKQSKKNPSAKSNPMEKIRGKKEQSEKNKQKEKRKRKAELLAKRKREEKSQDIKKYEQKVNKQTILSNRWNVADLMESFKNKLNLGRKRFRPNVPKSNDSDPKKQPDKLSIARKRKAKLSRPPRPSKGRKGKDIDWMKIAKCKVHTEESGGDQLQAENKQSQQPSIKSSALGLTPGASDNEMHSELKLIGNNIQDKKEVLGTESRVDNIVAETQQEEEQTEKNSIERLRLTIDGISENSSIIGGKKAQIESDSIDGLSAKNQAQEIESDINIAQAQKEIKVIDKLSSESQILESELETNDEASKIEGSENRKDVIVEEIQTEFDVIEDMPSKSKAVEPELNIIGDVVEPLQAEKEIHKENVSQNEKPKPINICGDEVEESPTGIELPSSNRENASSKMPKLESKSENEEMDQQSPKMLQTNPSEEAVHAELNTTILSTTVMEQSQAEKQQENAKRKRQEEYDIASAKRRKLNNIDIDMDLQSNHRKRKDKFEKPPPKKLKQTNAYIKELTTIVHSNTMKFQLKIAMLWRKHIDAIYAKMRRRNRIKNLQLCRAADLLFEGKIISSSGHKDQPETIENVCPDLLESFQSTDLKETESTDDIFEQLDWSLWKWPKHNDEEFHEDSNPFNLPSPSPEPERNEVDLEVEEEPSQSPLLEPELDRDVEEEPDQSQLLELERKSADRDIEEEEEKLNESLTFEPEEFEPEVLEPEVLEPEVLEPEVLEPEKSVINQREAREELNRILDLEPERKRVTKPKFKKPPKRPTGNRRISKKFFTQKKKKIEKSDLTRKQMSKESAKQDLKAGGNNVKKVAEKTKKTKVNKKQKSKPRKTSKRKRVSDKNIKTRRKRAKQAGAKKKIGQREKDGIGKSRR